MTNAQKTKINNWVEAIKDRYSYKGQIEAESELLDSGRAYVYVRVNGVDVFDSTFAFSFIVGRRGGVYQDGRTVKSIFSLEKI